MHDQVIVFAGFNISTISAHGLPDFFECLGIVLLHGGQCFKFFSTLFHHQLSEGVACAGGWWRAQNFDLFSWQRRVDFVPHLVGVVDQLAVLVRHLLGERHENLLLGELTVGARDSACESQAVKTNLDFNDIGDAVLHTGFKLGFLDGTRCVGEIRVISTGTGTEQLEATAGAC